MKDIQDMTLAERMAVLESTLAEARRHLRCIYSHYDSVEVARAMALCGGSQLSDYGHADLLLTDALAAVKHEIERLASSNKDSA